ncbi:MAG: hypothetical protein HETSPECPRED_006480 [Heterodermia speciosa]|uniref:Uncharacterized protein n=1 Tax=Heterodermia speciosa TaxID=116794 RepID=A0A8H3FPF4_9LECA|nr:MAG: hypothetical protein HETSPECPRED_006480 [Heterodermia speciosa]
MHPNDILYVLAFVLVNPLASAAPIFPNSNDIDENGYFIPGAGARRPVPGFTGPKDRRDIIGTLEGVANRAVNDVEGFINNIFKERDLDMPTLPKRDIIGTLEGVANGAINDVEGFVNNIFKERDLKGDLNSAIDDANQALDKIAGDVDPSFNPPDIPNLPRRDIIGTLEGVANGAVNDVEGVLNGIFGKRDGAPSAEDCENGTAFTEGTQDQCEPGTFIPDDACIGGPVEGCGPFPAGEIIGKRHLAQRDIVGTLEGVANGAISDVEGVVNSIFGKRDGADSLHLTLAEIRRMQAADNEISKRAIDRRDLIGTLEGMVNGGINDVEGVVNGLFGKRDIIGTLEGVANGAINDVEGVVNSIFKERDLVGDLNGAIDSANQAFDTVAGDVDSSFNPPDIPNIPTKRDLVGDLNGAIDSANQAIGTLAGDIDPNLNPPDIPNIPSKRDLVGDLNGAIDSANQAIGTIAGDVDPNFNPPDIPNIPSKRFVCGKMDGCDGPLFPGDFPGGVGPVIEEKVQPTS